MQGAGKRDHKVTVMRKIETGRTGLNTPTYSWAAYGSWWASRVDIRDSERVQNDHVKATINGRFRVGWSAKAARITPLDRISHGGRTYDIFSVKEIGYRKEVEITAGAEATEKLP